MSKIFFVMGILTLSLTSQADHLQKVYCQYGTDNQNLNSISMDLHGQKLSNMELDGNGLSSGIAKLGSAFAGAIAGHATSSKLSVNHVDSTQNSVQIQASVSGKSYQWRGTIEIHIPAPRADEYQPGTQLDKLIEGKFPVECDLVGDDNG